MTTVLAPGVHVQASKPFGDTPARGVDALMARWVRSARARTVVVSLVFIVAALVFWHAGKPIWGNWAETNAVITSQRDYQGRFDPACDLGLAYRVDGRQIRTHASVPEPCTVMPSIGAAMVVRHDQFDPGWVQIRGFPQPTGLLLIGLSVLMLTPLASLALYLGIAWRRVAAVRQLGDAPWYEITGTVQTSPPATRNLLRLALQHTGPGQANTELRFGIRPISFFPLPAAGSTFTVRVTGTGSGKVLVALPGHAGVALGTITATP